MTVAESQGRFNLTEEGVNINKNANKINYADTPYVSYLYRTNIDLSGVSNTIIAAYSVNKFKAYEGHTGTAKFGQVIEGVVSDGETWNIVTHKPVTFGSLYKDQANVGYLDSICISPWCNVAGVEITGDEFADIQYVGFFHSETAANNFDYALYLDSFKVEVTVEINGETNDDLSGTYMPGATIELPKSSGVAGYVVDGDENEMVVMSARVPEDAYGEITISATSRTVNSESYITYDRGDLNNLKKAYKEKEEITVVYIGGSVTAGHGSTNKANMWTSLTTKYLKTKFKNVIEFNEAMGGHGSRSAAYRIEKDILAHEPDIVFIETSMNDVYDGDVVDGVYDGKYYEYLVRTIREELPNTEIITVYIASYGAITDEDENGNRVLIEGKYVAAAGQDAIAAEYGIPSIDASKYTFEAIFGEGPYNGETWAKYYKDATDVHPIDAGYALYARAVEDYLEVSLADVDDCPDEVSEETCPEAPINAGVLTFTPEIIPLDDPAVSVNGFELIDSRKSSTFTNYLKLIDNPGSGTVKFSFVGTELGIFMKMPDEDDTGYEGGDPDAEQSSAISGVTVTIDDTVYTEKPKRSSPMMYSDLEDTKHDVTITFTNVPAADCPIYGLMVDGRLTQYTVELTASVGGQVSYNGETGTVISIYAMEGEKITFTAIPEEEHYLRNWHDLTYGQMTPLTDADGNTYANGEAPETITYKVVGDALINANFAPDDIETPVKLVAFVDRFDMGDISFADSNDSNSMFINEYVSASEPTKIKANAYDGYVAAYWKRLSQDSEVEVFVAAGADADVYALGGYVFYQPVFLEEGQTVDLYINAATNEILSVDEEPTGYTYVDANVDSAVVDVFVCTVGSTSDERNLFTAYGIDGSVVDGTKNPSYSDNIIIKKTPTNNTPLWTIVVGESEYTASYKDNFSFNYMFAAGTEVKVYEKALTKEAAPTVSTVASWTEDGQTKFTGIFALPEGYTLINHGIMMSKNKEELEKLEDNDTGEITVYDEMIVGRIRDNSENATPLFTVSKSLGNEADVWYGRAFLVYKDTNGNTHLTYASTTTASIEKGDADGDEELYAPAC